MMANTRSGSSCCGCKGKLRKNDDALVCSECLSSYHLDCASVAIEDFCKMREDLVLESWKCKSCADITSKESESQCDPKLQPAVDGLSCRDPVLSREQVSCGSCLCLNCPVLKKELDKLVELIKLQSAELTAMRREFNVRLFDIKAQLDNKNYTKSKPSERRASGSAELEIVGNSNKTEGNNRPQKSNSTTDNSHVYKKGKQTSEKSAVGTTYHKTVINEQVNELGLPSAVADSELAITNRTEAKADSEFKLVERRRHRKTQLTVGTDEARGGFSGIPKYAWLYIGRAQSGTTPDNVRTHLETKCPGIDFKVETLRSDDRSCSFKVGFDMGKLDRVTGSDIWPRNIIVRRFFRSAASENKGERRKSEGVPLEHTVPQE